MEGNKDEALRCRNVAKQVMDKSPAKALKLLEKSMRMYPCKVTQALIDQLTSGTAEATDSANTEKAQKSDDKHQRPATEEPHRRARATSPRSQSKARTRSASGPKMGVDYTSAQEKLCKDILSKKSYYDVLGVSKQVNDEEIKKAYKKLAFQLHPDKCKAPSAEEAFKKVSTAFQCLSDTKRREDYDKYGSEDSVPQQQRAHYQQTYMTPEELFEQFFGFHTGSTRVFHFGGGQRHHNRQGGQRPSSPLYSLVQAAPIIVLLLLTVVTNFMQSSSAVFSLQKNSEFSIERMTQTNQVPYFVRRSFDRNYPPRSVRLRELEGHVEYEYYTARCREDHNLQIRKLQDSLYRGKVSRAEYHKKYRDIRDTTFKTPECRRARELQRHYGSAYAEVW